MTQRKMSKTAKYSPLLAAVVLSGGFYAQAAHAECNATAKWFEKYTAATDAQKKGDANGALAHAKEAMSVASQACEKQASFLLERSAAYATHNWAEYSSVLEAMNASDIVSAKEKTENLKALSTAYQQQKRLDKAVGPLREYVKATGGTAADWNNLADLEMAANNCSGALAAVEKASGGKNLSEKQLSIQQACYFKSKESVKRLAVLEQLATKYPKKSYFVDLLALYQGADAQKQIQKLDDRAILNLLRLGYQRDWITESDQLLLYAKLADTSGASNEALRVLDKSLEKKRITADDKSKSLEAQEKRAATEDAGQVAQLDKESQAGKNGDKDVKVGMMYFGLEKYPDAVAALSRGLSPDHSARVQRPDDANMALGIAYARQKKFPEAEKAFNAAKADPRMTKAAELWIALMKG